MAASLQLISPYDVSAVKKTYRMLLLSSLASAISTMLKAIP
jgi:hypothetical protein